MEKALLQELVDKNYSLRQIAGNSGVSCATIRYWLRKYDLRTKRGPHGKKPPGFITERKCGKCGESDVDKFYGHKAYICGKCHNQYTAKRGRQKRLFALKELGGKCAIPDCGYSAYSCSLDIHHLDPSEKDPSFASMRGWSLERIRKELKKCVLLWKNCHAAVHADCITI